MWNFIDFIAYRCIVGSRAYGLETDSSDTDYRGFYLPRTEAFWGLTKPPEQLENEERQECFWELEKFVKLALANNPTVMECLYTSLFKYETDCARELREMRAVFPSKQAYPRYKGYIDQQLRRLGAPEEADGLLKGKKIMHVLRLLISGSHLARTGDVLVDVSQHRERLLAVKDGKMEAAELHRWRTELIEDFELAWSQTELQDEPDSDRAEQFLIRVRRSMVGAEC